MHQCFLTYWRGHGHWKSNFRKKWEWHSPLRTIQVLFFKVQSLLYGLSPESLLNYPINLYELWLLLSPCFTKTYFFLPWTIFSHIYSEIEKGENSEGTGNPKSRLDTVDRLLSISRTDRYCAWVTSCMQKRSNVPWARSNASAVKRGACSMSAVSTISMSFSRRRSWGRRPSYS